MQINIPLNDLRRRNESIAAELRQAFEDVLSDGLFILGSRTQCFESDFAAYCGVRYAVGVANGTDALELALIAIGCGAGDEIITVANAGGYSTHGILHVGATPIYADIDSHTLLITPDTFMQAITPATKAIIVTHLYGLMADMLAICNIAKQHGIIVIEDCAQAHGASLIGKKAGAWGSLGCFSFYPTKNLGAIGDAGCIITDDQALEKTLRSLRQYGWRNRKYQSEVIGYNSRMDALQAAVLSNALCHLDRWNDKRRQIAEYYRKELSEHNIIFQKVNYIDGFVAHLCVIRIQDRERLMQSLTKAGIASDIHYPIPDYNQPAFIDRIQLQNKLPITEQITSQILTIPCFPEMMDTEIQAVVIAIKQHYENRSQ